MDLGIAGRWAIVCGSSQGLGKACAAALAAEGVNVVVNGRDADKLRRTAEEIRKLGPGQVAEVSPISLRRKAERSSWQRAPNQTSWSPTIPARVPATWTTSPRTTLRMHFSCTTTRPSPCLEPCCRACAREGSEGSSTSPPRWSQRRGPEW